jgi:hypothetical protein
MIKTLTSLWCGSLAMALCSCAYSPRPGGNTNVTSPSHSVRDSHDVTTVTMAPGSTYAPTLLKNSGSEDGYNEFPYERGATRFSPRENGVVRVAPNRNPNFTGY